MKTDILPFGGTQMFVSSRNARQDSFAPATGNSATDSGTALLEDLLAHTITVRYLYRYRRADVIERFGETVQSGGAGGAGIALEK
jgi:hypothetical protein